MKRFYYKTMAEATEMIGWNLFAIEAYSDTYLSRKFFRYAQNFNRKLNMLNHPSSGRK